MHVGGFVCLLFVFASAAELILFHRKVKRQSELVSLISIPLKGRLYQNDFVTVVYILVCFSFDMLTFFSIPFRCIHA